MSALFLDHCNAAFFYVLAMFLIFVWAYIDSNVPPPPPRGPRSHDDE